MIICLFRAVLMLLNWNYQLYYSGNFRALVKEKKNKMGRLRYGILQANTMITEYTFPYLRMGLNISWRRYSKIKLSVYTEVLVNIKIKKTLQSNVFGDVLFLNGTFGKELKAKSRYLTYIMLCIPIMNGLYKLNYKKK